MTPVMVSIFSQRAAILVHSSPLSATDTNLKRRTDDQSSIVCPALVAKAS